ncbi:hypothetical protein [Fischerella thermalis]|uniref:hypothetical protein n=1 Tax=Fischerella thermalis TaxID=372787 RepID=UPI00241FC31F|nr:hypothetical protein [Fischerella thermalis]
MNKLKQFWVSLLTIASLVSLSSNAQAQWYTPIPPPETYIMPSAIESEICRQNPEVRNHPRCQNPGSLGLGNQRHNTNAPNSTINPQLASAYLKQGFQYYQEGEY